MLKKVRRLFDNVDDNDDVFIESSFPLPHTHTVKCLFILFVEGGMREIEDLFVISFWETYSCYNFGKQ